jgi:hypothetical protein
VAASPPPAATGAGGTGGPPPSPPPPPGGTGGPPPSPPPRPLGNGAAAAAASLRDLSDQAADRVIETVERVRSVTTGPVLKASRALVYGLVAFAAAIVLLVLVIVAAIRLLDQLPGGVWLPYLILGVIFSMSGLIAWYQRRPAA